MGRHYTIPSLCFYLLFSPKPPQVSDFYVRLKSEVKLNSSSKQVAAAQRSSFWTAFEKLCMIEATFNCINRNL